MKQRFCLNHLAQRIVSIFQFLISKERILEDETVPRVKGTKPAEFQLRSEVGGSTVNSVVEKQFWIKE